MKKSIKALVLSITYILAFALGMGSTKLLSRERANHELPGHIIENRKEVHEAAVIENKDKILSLSDGRWYDRTVDEKLDALQTVVDLEILFLGLPHDVPIILAELEDSEYANYSNKDKTIYMDRDRLETSEYSFMLLMATCQEIFHAYQFTLVYLYDDTDEIYKGLRLFDDARTYRQEFLGFYSMPELEYDPWGDSLPRSVWSAERYALSSVKFYTEFFDENSDEWEDDEWEFDWH